MKKFYFLSISLIVLIFTFITFINFASAIDSMYAGYSISSGAVNEAVRYWPGAPYTSSYGYCGYVDNSTGKTLFIGTATKGEWDSFANNETISGADGCDDEGSSNSLNSYRANINGCNSWDWNCDGTISKQYTYMGYILSSCSSDDACIDPAGWLTSSVPGCGVTDSWMKPDCINMTAYGGTCDETTNTQECK
jgi:hypothetical protein